MTNLTFPGPPILDQLRTSGRLEAVLTDCADVLRAAIYAGSVENYEVFILAYLRTRPVMNNQDLRVAAFALIFNYGVLINPSIESVWDILFIYGPRNRTVVANYLEDLSDRYKPKLARFVLTVASQDWFPELQQIITLILDTKFRDIVSSDWLEALRDLKTRAAKAIFQIANQHSESMSTRMLRALFPQLSIVRANELLAHSNVELLSQKLLDDPSLIAGPAKVSAPAKFIKLDPKRREAKRDDAHAQKTLQLAAKYLEDDPDDEVETTAETLSVADKALRDQDLFVYNIYLNSPEAFTKAGRKTKSREQLKKRLDWTDEQIEGWALMLQRDPRREAKLRWDAEMSPSVPSSARASPAPANETSRAELQTSVRPKGDAAKKPKAGKPRISKPKYKEHHKDKPVKE